MKELQMMFEYCESIAVTPYSPDAREGVVVSNPNVMTNERINANLAVLADAPIAVTPHSPDAKEGVAISNPDVITNERINANLVVLADAPASGSKAEAPLHFETRKLMRIAFYDALGRRPPAKLRDMPSYVRRVKKHWNLQFSNTARRLLAQIEGYRSWDEMMAEAELD